MTWHRWSVDKGINEENWEITALSHYQFHFSCHHSWSIVLVVKSEPKDNRLLNGVPRIKILNSWTSIWIHQTNKVGQDTEISNVTHHHVDICEHTSPLSIIFNVRRFAIYAILFSLSISFFVPSFSINCISCVDKLNGSPAAFEGQSINHVSCDESSTARSEWLIEWLLKEERRKADSGSMLSVIMLEQIFDPSAIVIGGREKGSRRSEEEGRKDSLGFV